MDDQSEKSQQQYMADGADQMGNSPPPLPGMPVVVATTNVCVPVSSTMQPPLLPVPTPQQRLPYQEAQAQHMENVRERLRIFWANQMQEMTGADRKNNSLPLAPIKRIMKADKDVRMISKETAALFAKACEMFILDMTSQAWINTEDDGRRTLQKKDIVATIVKANNFDFLEHMIPRDKLREQMLKATNAGQQGSSSTAPRIHGYNVPRQHGIGASSVTSAGGQQPPPFMPWYQPGPQIHQIFMPVPQAQSQQPFIPWPQTQQQLYQQTAEQLLISCFQAGQTPYQQNPYQPSPQAGQHPFIPWPQAQQQLDQQTAEAEQLLISYFQAEQTPDQQNPEQQPDQQNPEQQPDQQNPEQQPDQQNHQQQGFNMK